MPKLIKSDRLTLRPLMRSDYSFLRSLHSNPEVMRYISSGRIRSEEETYGVIERGLLMEVENPLLGGWIVLFTETMQEIGNVVLRKPATREETEGLEIGYIFIPEYWGRGLATEAARCIMDYAYREIGDVKLVALIDPDNEASRKTLLKLGFRTTGFSEYVDPGTGIGVPTEVLEVKTSSSK